MKSLYTVPLFIIVIAFVRLSYGQDKPAVEHQNNQKVKGKTITRHVELHATQTDNTLEEMAKFDAYIKKHKRAIPGAKGTVLVSFTNEANGSLTNIKIAKSLNKAADREVLHLVKAYPKMEPPLFNGKPERSALTVPITFGK